MSPITTHVLDTALGSPVEGIAVTLYRVKEDEADVEVGRAAPIPMDAQQIYFPRVLRPREPIE